MIRIKVRQRTNHFFWAFGIVILLALGLSNVHAATIPAKGSNVAGERLTEKADEYENDWALWLKEGNAQSFLMRLEEIARCVEADKLGVDHLPAELNDMSPCQKQMSGVLNYRDSEGHNLLQVYLKNSKPDNPGDIQSILVIKEAVDVINALLRIGMTMMDWDNQQPDSDNLLFLTLKYDKFGLLNQLLAGIKEFDSEKYQRLPKLRSSKGVSLANAIQKKKQDEPFALYLITNFELIRDAEELEIKSGVVYVGALAWQMTEKREL